MNTCQHCGEPIYYVDNVGWYHANGTRFCPAPAWSDELLVQASPCPNAHLGANRY